LILVIGVRPRTPFDPPLTWLGLQATFRASRERRTAMVRPKFVTTKSEELRARFQVTQLPAPVWEGMASSVLDQIYRSREAFVQTSQNALTTAVLFYTAAATLVVFLVTVDHSPSALQVGSATSSFLVLTWIPWLRRKAWQSKVDAGYELYVAACVHAAVVYDALGFPFSHQWLGHVDECGNIRGDIKLVVSKAEHRLITARKEAKKAKEALDATKPAVATVAPQMGANAGSEDLDLELVVEDHLWGPRNSREKLSARKRYNFVPSLDQEKGKFPTLDSVDKILAVWKVRGTNLHYFYRVLFSSTLLWIAVLSLVAATVLVLLHCFGWAFPEGEVSPR
jgi:hypothetical protein